MISRKIGLLVSYRQIPRVGLNESARHKGQSDIPVAILGARYPQTPRRQAMLANPPFT